jgi:hypothetical protein
LGGAAGDSSQRLGSGFLVGSELHHTGVLANFYTRQAKGDYEIMELSQAD